MLIQRERERDQQCGVLCIPKIKMNIFLKSVNDIVLCQASLVMKASDGK